MCILPSDHAEEFYPKLVSDEGDSERPSCSFPLAACPLLSASTQLGGRYMVLSGWETLGGPKSKCWQTQGLVRAMFWIPAAFPTVWKSRSLFSPL